MIRKLLFIVAFLFAFIGTVRIAEGGRIHFKAWFAQVLLEDAWDLTKQGQTKVLPWPWADTWPVAKLTVPSLDIGQIVLHGDSGNSLAFGPGMRTDTPNLLSVLSGHNDTHFAFLEHIKRGDKIHLEISEGSREFVVTDIEVSSADLIRVSDENHTETLILTTCYPFDSRGFDSKQRYIVMATIESER